ncbi:fungal specific transcription factor [Pochonia chlamydosporia 170]|uniref:Fungal specific transcription factor n=1 Tax=Pochonia chlamydosporia 170 TaxID=1380566 RepID=A0A179F617_METCM|nr:fungal specific transcription factor [Pochonia chlamydosporia 170]OAQ60868.2 fungal specific transcription factor [Pochonia chlamydosporia 170]
MDSLVQNFFSRTNFRFYLIYPPSFLEEYRSWWSLRSENRPLGLQWTCLLLTVCACSTQDAHIELQRRLETDLRKSTQNLAENYHNAARELHGAIPIGNNHLLSTQSLLHSCYWHMSAAQFVECWHFLNTAIREAQELGIHTGTVTGYMPEFDLEMRRRIWRVLDTWDCDRSRPWIVLHRHYLQTMVLSMLLDPGRAYLIKPMSNQSPPDELKIRNDGIDYSLQLMRVLQGFFDHIYPRDAQIHFVLFYICDNAAVLCSALIHDQNSSLPKRHDVLNAVGNAVLTLQRFKTVTKTVRASYKVLVKIAQNIKRQAHEAKSPIEPMRKLPNANELALAPPSMTPKERVVARNTGSMETNAHFSLHMSLSTCPGPSASGDKSTLNYSPSYDNMTLPTTDLCDDGANFDNFDSFGAITEKDLDDLAALWSHESTNLHFINPEGVK